MSSNNVVAGMNEIGDPSKLNRTYTYKDYHKGAMLELSMRRITSPAEHVYVTSRII